MKYSCIFTSVFFHFVKSTCYFPNGTPLTSNNHPGVSVTDYVPCNPDPNSFSMCCATNRTHGNDECLPNGLCSTNGETSLFYRESCSDPSWNSPFCLRDVCTNSTNGGNFTSDSGMAKCEEDGSWCCGFPLTSQSCCNMKDERRFFLASTAGLGGSNVIGTPGMESSTSTSSTPSTTTTAEIASPTSSISSSAVNFPTSMLKSSSTTGVTTFSFTPTVTSSSYPTDTTASPQISTLISTVSPPLWYSHKSSTSSSNSPTPTTSADAKPHTEIKMHIGVGVALGFIFILLLSLLIFTWHRKRRFKALPEPDFKSRTMASSWDDASFSKPELDTREEIHMIGYNENQWRIGKAELSEVRAERFELEAGGRRDTAGVGNGNEMVEKEKWGGVSGLGMSNVT